MDSKNPLISVIVPVYNSDQFLDKNLSSIVNQSYKKLQIIIVNDGSNDDSETIINKFKQQDSRIVSLKQSNQGLGSAGSARNTGLSEAQGEYVMFIDSDDFLLKSSAIQTIVDKLNNEKSDLLIFGYELFFSHRKPIIKKALLDIDKMYIGSWNKVYKLDLVRNLKFAVGEFYEDTKFVLLSRLRSKTTSVVDECLYAYVQHSGSITARNSDYKRHYDIIHVLRPVIESSDFLNSSKKMQEKTRIAINYQLITHIVVMLDNLPSNYKKTKNALIPFFEFEDILYPNHNYQFSESLISNKIWQIINSAIRRNPYSCAAKLFVWLINAIRATWRE